MGSPFKQMTIMIIFECLLLHEYLHVAEKSLLSKWEHLDLHSRASDV